jgi:hypothetical protein
MQARCLALRAGATSTRDCKLEQRRPTASAPEVSEPTGTSRKVAFAQSQSAAELEKKEIKGQYVDAIKQAFVEAAAQLTGSQVELDVGSAVSDAESIEPSEAGTRRSSRQTLATTRRTRSTSGSLARFDSHVMVPADLLLRTLAASNSRTVSNAAVSHKPFTGRADQDPDESFECFERY